MKIPNTALDESTIYVSLARIVSEDSQQSTANTKVVHKSSKDS